MLFKSTLATSEQKYVERFLLQSKLSKKNKAMLDLLLSSLYDRCWFEIIMVTCRVESKCWDLPSSGPARCPQDARRVLHNEPSGPKVLGDRTQGRHGNPFLRCGAPHRTSGV